MKPDYKNWVPKGMLAGFAAGLAAALALLLISLFVLPEGLLHTILLAMSAVAAVILLAATLWLTMMHRAFSYNGKRQLAKAIVEGTAAYISIPDGGTGLDVGCGSGALTIACAKRNPRARMIGIDRWGKEYASFNKSLCEQNARAENVSNTSFQQGNALHLDFPDESFDAVTSNYVYHNITGADKQDCLRETLRVLKKGGAFALHDIMSKSRYGDMEAFAAQLRAEGYERVELIDTTNGMFMSRKEAVLMDLSGSTLLVGRK
ncbi:MAG: class I SAM-dependent methyltransferase [Clostridia bacterium]|nr:class I SAM-dependent methyltransferase [Clostridia bacterium]